MSVSKPMLKLSPSQQLQTDRIGATVFKALSLLYRRKIFSNVNNSNFDRAVVVERSNTLVYLITSLLELKVEGSSPGGGVFFRVLIN